MGISNLTLVKIGAIGGIATVSMGLLLRRKIHNNIKDSDHYKDALKILQSNKGAMYLLGEPIKVGTIDVGNQEKNYTTDNEAKHQIPIKGPKQAGILHLWAKKTEQNQWIVNRIELALNNEPKRRLLIKNLDEKQ